MPVFRQIEYGSADYDLTYQLREEVLRKPLGLSLHQEDLAAEQTMLHFGLFHENGGLLACVIAVPLSPTKAKIRQMAVQPSHQGQGMGRQVIEALEWELLSRGFCEVELHARAAVQGFYRSLGYTVTGQEFVEVGIPHVPMAKTLGR